MHYHLEIILPPSCADVAAAVEQILKPYSENEEEARHSFWDWYRIGGRYSGQHVIDRYDPERISAFAGELHERKVTVSGVRMGKEELSPPSHAATVDEIWKRHFPDSGLDHCPLFRRDDPERIPTDVCKVSELGVFASAHRVIIAGPVYDADNREHTLEILEAAYMLTTEFWSGVNHQETTWDGKVASAIEASNARFSNMAPRYAELTKVTPEHLAVTVDYHN